MFQTRAHSSHVTFRTKEEAKRECDTGTERTEQRRLQVQNRFNGRRFTGSGSGHLTTMPTPLTFTLNQQQSLKQRHREKSAHRDTLQQATTPDRPNEDSDRPTPLTNRACSAVPSFLRCFLCLFPVFPLGSENIDFSATPWPPSLRTVSVPLDACVCVVCVCRPVLCRIPFPQSVFRWGVCESTHSTHTRTSDPATITPINCFHLD